MKRVLLWTAVAALLVWGVARPALMREVEFESGDYDSNSDCLVRGDELIYHTPENFVDGLLGGHGRGYESFQFDRKAYRVVFAPDSNEVEVVRVHDCGVHLRGGETFALDGNSVDTALTSKRGRVVVDRIPDRGRGPAQEMVVDSSWDGKYRIRPSDADLDTFDLAAPLYDAGVLVTRGPEARGQGITYEVYDYANARRLRFTIPQAALPREANQSVRIKSDPNSARSL